MFNGILRIVKGLESMKGFILKMRILRARGVWKKNQEKMNVVFQNLLTMHSFLLCLVGSHCSYFPFFFEGEAFNFKSVDTCIKIVCPKIRTAFYERTYDRVVNIFSLME